MAQRRILVVEDSPTQAERVRLLLECEGYRVETAANGREGLRRIQASPPDIIISDVVMPEMDGFALCRAVKSAEATRRIPFVLLTQRSAPPDVIQGFEAGADNFIPKPFDDDALLERVRRIFEQMDRQACEGPEPEVALQIGGHRFVVSARKAQIVELLLFTLEDLARVNALLQARERDLEAKARELETFAYTVSHDLKAPLRGMEGFAKALYEDYADRLDETGRHYLDMVQGSARRMGALIDDLLRYSRVERRAMRWEPVDLERLLHELLRDRRAEIESRGVRIEVKPTVYRIAGEREGLQEALTNLLDNALKFTRKTAQPVITITAGVKREALGVRGQDTSPHALPLTPDERHRETGAGTQEAGGGDFVEIAVADNGVGFDPQYREKAFTIFERLHPQDEYEGTGIGLAIVRKVAERHGGHTWADSAPGQGATFYLAIPIRKEDSDA
ncbi:MAG: hypothetical protein C3F12_06605 [Candidatus Methylomirabilota bacterium]|nr:MAG: hypothetical protein C3F12_06605 [candidate division NC10 bacterium]